MRKPLIYILTILACLGILLSGSPTSASTFSSTNSQPIQSSTQPEADSPADSPTTPPAIAATRVFLPLVIQTPTLPGTLSQPVDFPNRGALRLPGGETPPLTFNPGTIPGFGAESLAGTPPVRQIVSGGTHTCALTPAGGVVCWGSNSLGQLGDGTTNQSDVPVAVRGLSSGVMSLALAWGRTCALTTLGRVYCWGGVIRPESGYHSVPVEIKGLGRPGGSVGGRGTPCLRADFFRQSPVLGL